MRAFWIAELVLLIGVLAEIPAAAAIRIEMIRGRPVVDGVYVNGHGPYRFLVDTGTTLNHIDRKLALSIGLTPTFRTELVSSTGATAAPGAEGVRVTIDSVQADDQVFLLAGLDVIREYLPRVQGVLGEVFLSRFDYLLDLQGKQLRFGKREPEANQLRASFQTVAGRPVLSTNLGPLVLDSGVASVTLFGVATRSASLRMFTMTGLTGLTGVGAIFRELAIEGRSVWRGDAIASPSSNETPVAGLLPVNLFKVVYVCNSEGYLIFN